MYMLAMDRRPRPCHGNRAGAGGRGFLRPARIARILIVDVNNGASIRVLEKIGMRWEAVFRKHRRARRTVAGMLFCSPAEEVVGVLAQPLGAP